MIKSNSYKYFCSLKHLKYSANGSELYENTYKENIKYSCSSSSSSKKRLQSIQYGDVILTSEITVKKQHRQAYRAAGTLPLLLLIVSMLTVPVMLFSAPLAAADVVSDCEKSGGKYVVKNGQGHCFITIEPDCHKLPPGEVVPDPELCLKAGRIIDIPIFDATDIAETVEDTLNEVAPVVIDGNLISESVRDSVEGIVAVISDGNL